MNEHFSTLYWLQQVEEIERQVGYGPLAEDFLSNPLLMNNMVANDPNPHWGNSELSMVESTFGRRGIEVLASEPRFGGAPFRTFVSDGGTSVTAPLNSIHHLYHCAIFDSMVGGYEWDGKRILEWGGGFGNMARLAKAMFAVEYSIIDLAFMTSIQARYLDRVLGPEHGVGLIPVDHLKYSSEEKCDLFVSTWALSECTVYAQEYVGVMDFFGASDVLIAHQKSSDLFRSAEDLEDICRRAGFTCYTRPFPFTGRGDQYLVGRR